MVVEYDHKQKERSNKEVAQEKEAVGLPAEPVRSGQQNNKCQQTRDETGKVEKVNMAGAFSVFIDADRTKVSVIRRPTLSWG
jgi:hypothetical protein